MRIATKLNGWLVAPFYLIVGVIFGLVVLRAGALVSLALLAGFVFMALAWRYPVFAILAIIAGTCFIPFSDNLPLTNIGSVHIPDLILYLLIGIVILKTMVLRNVRLIRTPLDLPLTIFVGVGVTSFFIGKVLQLYDFFQALHEFKVVLYYLLPVVITNIIRDKKELRILIYGCLCLGIAAALRVILNAWMDPPIAGDDPMELFYRYSEGSSGAMLSFWTSVTILCFIFVSKIRLSYILGAVIPVFSLILSFSRHWWISSVFAVSLVCVFNFKKNKARIFGILSLIILLVFLVIGAFVLRIEPVTTYLKLIALRADSLTAKEKFGTWEIRTVENKYAIEKILSSPIWGIGFQRPYRPQIYGPDDNIEWYIHNGYLWILLKMGILGLLPFVWFSYIFIKRGLKYWNKVEENFLQGIVLGSAVSYLGVALGNIAAPHFMSSWQTSLFGLILGISEVIYRIEGLDLKPEARSKMQNTGIYP